MNAGLFVIDIEKWRTDRVQTRSIEAVHRHPGINDEEALNIALQHDWLEISPKWNYLAIYLGLDLERALGPVVYHYYDGPKPWHSCAWFHEQVHRDRHKQFFKDSPWPKAAFTLPPRRHLARFGKLKVKAIAQRVPLVRDIPAVNHGRKFIDDVDELARLLFGVWNGRLAVDGRCLRSDCGII